MKSIKYWILLVTMFMVAGLSACGNDDGDGADGGGDIKPGNVNDPSGTVELSMMRGAYKDATKLGNSSIYINESYNFTNAEFASFGKINGLGNIASIPTTGWASSVAVEAGYGYIAYDNGVWYRIYVGEEIGGTSGGVIGYKVKYQSPFKGPDEELMLKQESLTFEAKGGTINLLFENKKIIPFTIKVDSGTDWCKAYACSSYDFPYLNNGISVTVSPTKSSEKAEALITLTTLYGKSKTVKIIRSGSEPYIELDRSEYTVESDKQSYDNFTVFSNCNFSELTVTSSAAWCQPELIDESNMLRSNIAKFIDGKSVDEALTRATNENSVRSYRLKLNVNENLDNDVRTAEIVVKTKSGKQMSGMVLTQKKGYITFYGLYQEGVLYVVTRGGTSNISFNSSTNYENLKVSSNAGWCTPTISDNNVNITCLENSSEQSRSCKVTLAAKQGSLKEEVTVIQEGGYIKPDKYKAFFDKNAGNQSIRLNTDFTSIEPLSDASWCTFSYNASAKTITIRTDPNTNKERAATISFKNSTAIIKVIQSNYSVGDTYNENGVTGMVKYMQDSIRLVVSDILGTYAWSIEEVATGATFQSDGRKNMEVIKEIPNWRTLYPAFAAVDALNVNGVIGWYLPSYYENKFMNLLGWSSTESSNIYARFISSSFGDIYRKTNKLSVVGAYLF